MTKTTTCAKNNFAIVENEKHDSATQSLATVPPEKTELITGMSLRDHLEMYWEFFFVKGNKIPEHPLPQKRLRVQELFDGPDDQIKSAWLGHSSVFINIDGFSILTDPVFENKVSLVGPTRFNKKLPIHLDDLHSVDTVLISHDHYDHLNKYSIQFLTEKTTVFIVPSGIGKKLRKWGVPTEKIAELTWGDKYRLQKGLKITATPSQHFSGRGLFDRNKTLWASWVIRTRNHRIFFSGDSGYFTGFRDIGMKYGPFNVAFLECGAYNHGWSRVHMFPEQTVQAALDLNAQVLHPIHWGTLNLALHPWYEPMERLTHAAFLKQVTTCTPVMGEIVDHEKTQVTGPWWKQIMKSSRKNNASRASHR